MTKTTTTTADPTKPHGGVEVDEPAVVDDQADDEDTRPRVDLLDPLTIAEIDAGSRQLGTSLTNQLRTKGERYEHALAVVLWLHQRRADRNTEPGALLKQLTALSFSELVGRCDELSLQLGAAKAEAADPLE